MKIVTIIVSLFIFSSCVDPKKATVDHFPFVDKEGGQFLEPEVNIPSRPEVFVAFYWPEKLDWEPLPLDLNTFNITEGSPLYHTSEPYSQKLAKVVAAVNKLSDDADRIETESYQLINSEIYKKTEQQANECMMNGDFSDECVTAMELAEKHGKVLEQNLALKGKRLDTTMMLLDEFEHRGDGRFPNKENPENFILLGDADRNRFTFSEGDIEKILLPKFGNDKIKYSSSRGDITDISVRKNSKGRTVIEFLVHEKDAGDVPTEFIHKFSLERKDFLNFVRLFGSIFYYHKDNPGKMIRKGKAKIDFKVEF